MPGRLLAYLDANPALVVLLDREGRIQELNAAGADLLGVPRASARGRAWLDFVPPERRDEVRRLLTEILAGEHDAIAPHKHELVTASGERRLLLWRNAVLGAPGPAAEGCIATGIDVTASEGLEGRLAASEARLHALLERFEERERWLQASQRAARIGHYVFDVPADRWTSSPVLDEIFGIGPEHDRSSEGWLAVVHPDDRPTMAVYLRDLLARGSRFDRVYRLRGDPLRWVHGLGELERDAAGQPRRLFGTIQDITAHHRAEQAQEALADQLRQAQKLESIGRLAGGVAHDFNNILVVLLGCAEALRRSELEGNPPAPEDVDELQEAALRAKDLTSQLLAFARKQVVAPVVLDLNQEVRRAERILQRVLGEDILLELSLGSGLPTITFDPGQLQQVLMNLAVNARDAMPVGGRLVISTAFEMPQPAEAGWLGPPVPDARQVRLLVEDTGQGIPRELWPRIFEPFVTTKGAGRGTGLGLATVYGIAQQAAGAVRFRSEPGRGTAFELLLPPAGAQAAEAAPGRRPLAGVARAGERILVVEDDDLVRGAASRALHAAGFEVTVAASGEAVQALVARGEAAPQLLLTDVVMPEMNGRQVAELALAAWPGLKVLFMSGYAQDIIVHHGVVDDGVDLLEKPFTGEALVSRVRAALDR